MGLGVAVEAQREVRHALHAFAEVTAAGGLDAEEAATEEELQQGHVVDGQIPDHAHVGLEQAEVDPQGVVVADLAELAAVDQLGDLPHRPGVDVGVIDHQHARLALRDLDQHLGLGAGGGERFFDQDVLAGLERGEAQLVVGGDRRGHDDRLDVGPRDQLDRVVEEEGTRVTGAGGLAASRAPIGDGRQGHAADLAEVAREVGAPVAEADETDPQVQDPAIIAAGARPTVSP